jgi:hypothetical protein
LLEAIKVKADECEWLRVELLRLEAETATEPMPAPSGAPAHPGGAPGEPELLMWVKMGEVRGAQQAYRRCLLRLEQLRFEAVEESRREQIRLGTFEGVAWGVGYEEVAERKGEPAHEATGIVCYDVMRFRLPALACFYFETDADAAETEQGLVQGRYVFISQHDSASGYASDFDRVAAAIARRYGPPVRDQEAWSAQPGEGETFAEGLERGAVTRVATWLRPGGVMTMHLQDSGGTPVHVLEFMPLVEQSNAP